MWFLTVDIRCDTELMTIVQQSAYHDITTKWDMIPGTAGVSTPRLSVADVLASIQSCVDEDDGDDDY